MNAPPPHPVEEPFPLISQPRRQPRLLRAAWAGVTLALWTAYGYLALSLVGGDLWEDLAVSGWVVRHRLDITLLWLFAVGACGASLLLVAWAELDRARERRAGLPRSPNVRAGAIARRLHASNALHRQLTGAKIVRLHLDEQARPVSAESQPLPATRLRRRGQTGTRVCPAPRTTKRSTVNASSPIGP